MEDYGKYFDWDETKKVSICKRCGKEMAIKGGNALTNHLRVHTADGDEEKIITPKYISVAVIEAMLKSGQLKGFENMEQFKEAGFDR